MKKNHYLCLVCALLIISCNKSHKPIEVFSINLGNEVFSPFTASGLEVTHIMEFENPPGAILGFIWKLLKTTNEYILIDKKPEGGLVYRYDLSGKFLGAIGTIGRGPGEYINALDVEIAKNYNRIYVLCQAGKILAYNSSGSFIEEYQSPFSSSSFALSSNDNFLQYVTLTRSSTQHGIIEHDRERNNYKVIHQKQTEWYPIEELNFFRFAERVFFREAFSRTIFEISGENIFPLFEFEWPEKMYKSDFDQLDLISIFEKMAINGDFFSFRSMLYNENTLYASFGDELNQLTYHVLFNPANNSITPFYTNNPNDFFNAMLLNEKNQPGFFLQGAVVQDFASQNPIQFEKASSLILSEELTYLVFFGND